ncbi:transposase [Falsirhodobacter sp. 20TX0035]|uniref:transposase n=1 Tax=Falsirhodobacter sp. 20TX0035 TaxID=3022019 RepID=UPI003FA5A64B
MQTRKTRFIEQQIMAVLRQAEGSVAVPDLCRKHGISSASCYKWRRSMRHGRVHDHGEGSNATSRTCSPFRKPRTSSGRWAPWKIA